MRNAADRQHKKSRPIPVRRSSGNVFEDLGVHESAEALAKSEIAARIAAVIDNRGLTQAGAARLLEVSQADVSDLVRGKLRGFSTERLFRFLNALGQDVEIVILERHRSTTRRGSLRVLNRSPHSAPVGSRSKRA
jgi:predicted XRE-type DNA-binding protein